jgi:hypothetical protein
MKKFLEKLFWKFKLNKKIDDLKKFELDKFIEKVDTEKVAKTLNINQSFLAKRMGYYILKYGIVFGLLFLFNVFATNAYFFASVFLIGFFLSMDFTTMVLGRNKEFRENSKDVWHHERKVLVLQSMAFFLCTKGIMFAFLKPFFGCLFAILSAYATLELVRRSSEDPEASIKKYITYIPLMMLPLVVIDPFSMIFAIIYYLFIILLIPGIIFGMFYFVISLKDKIRFRIFGISFLLLYIMLALCL